MFLDFDEKQKQIIKNCLDNCDDLPKKVKKKDDNKIKFPTSKSGYLDLKNKKIYFCEVYDHFDFLKKMIFDIDYSEIEPILEDIDLTEQSCIELENKEGRVNAEWHCYEMAFDGGMREINQILIKNNILRFNYNGLVLFIDSRQDIFYGNAQKNKIQKVLSISKLKYNKIQVYFNDTYKNIEL